MASYIYEDDKNKISLLTPLGTQNETIITSSKFTTREQKSEEVRMKRGQRKGNCVVKVIDRSYGRRRREKGVGKESFHRRMGRDNMRNGII